MLAGTPQKFEFLTKFKIQSEVDYEVVPDSEEERQQQDTEAEEAKGGHPAKVVEVIEISSDDNDEERTNFNLTRPSSTSKHTPKRAGNRSNYLQARVIESSDEDSGLEIIELSDSSSEDVFVNTGPVLSKVKARVTVDPQVVSRPQSDVDESVIVFDEPRSARTPLRVGTERNKKTSKIGGSAINIRAPALTSGPSNMKISTPVSRRPFSKSSQGTPRANSKKALVAAELTRRREYAQQLFTELNILVFKQGLPQDTRLNWNKRLLTTAGRAKFHRSRDGVQTTEIELAEKILDCDERIRNTLSHEMCHLATWVIDNKVDEHHGKLFKDWASRVMKKRPDIHVSIKHDYEIAHPFQWKCEKCAKVYGRFSKSIRPDECVCGACKEGTLIPLFPTRVSTNQNTKLSRMAAARPQDSPRAMQGSPVKKDIFCEVSDAEDSEIDPLTNILASTSIF